MYYIITLRWHSDCVGGGPDLANLISDSLGGVAEEDICVCGGKWKWSGGAKDDYASVISIWPLRKTGNCKAKAKHSFETETTQHFIKLVGVPPGVCAVTVCV